MGYRLKHSQPQVHARKADAVLSAGLRMAAFTTWLKSQYGQLGKKHGEANQLERFVLRVDELYGDRKIRLYYQYDGPFFGYIIGITDKPANRKAEETEKGSMTTAEGAEVLPGQYSNVHEVGDENIRALAEGPQMPRGWDATAKIAAEGARWNCVERALRQGKLTDRLVFFTTYSGDAPKLAPRPADPHIGIRFKHLWLFWSSFKNAYGITDTEVIRMLNTWYPLQLDWDWAQNNQMAQPKKPDRGSPARWKEDMKRYELWQTLTTPVANPPGTEPKLPGRPGPPLLSGTFNASDPDYLELGP